MIANNWKSKIDNLFIQPQILEIGWMDKREERLIMSGFEEFLKISLFLINNSETSRIKIFSR